MSRTEVWETQTYPVPGPDGYGLEGPVTVTVKSTDPKWNSCKDWGQIAINWFEVNGYECSGPFCGDGLLNTELEEECDYGTANNGQPNFLCNAQCQLEEPTPECEFGELQNYGQVDFVNFGDSQSESDHSASGWGNDPGVGNYGGRDGETAPAFGLIVGTSECGGSDSERDASFVIHAGDKFVNKLRLRVLDGLSNLDDFNIYVNDSLAAHYIDVLDSQENWNTLEVEVPNLSGDITVRLRATGSIWSGCPIYGQIAVNWVEALGYECEWCGDISGRKTNGVTQSGVDGWNIYLVSPVSEEIIVPALNAQTITGPVLENGKQYIVKVSGTYSAGDTITADAECSLTSRITGDSWTPEVSGYESYGDKLLDLTLDGVGIDNVFWGECDSSHNYSTLVNGLGNAVTFRLNDFAAYNNSGWVTVQVFEVIDSQSTTSGGNYSFNEQCTSTSLYLFEETRAGWLRESPEAGFYQAEGEGSYNFVNRQFICGDGVRNQASEECDGTDGVAGDGSNFCTDTCKLIPVYLGDNACPDGKVKSALPVASETIKTNPTATEYTVVSGLTAGNDYLIEVSGKYQFDPGMATKWADAAYASYAADGAGSLPWNLRYDLGIRPTTGKDAVGNYKSRGITSLISDMGTGAMGVVDWGSFDQNNEDHYYSILYRATASSPRFIISEWYGDWYKTSKNNVNTWNNLGSLNLEVYECVEPGIIKGTKYLDENANGVHDYNLSLSDVYESQLLNGWTIRLYDQNWNKADEMDTANLGNKGQYIFNGVVPGTYYVCEVMEDGWEQTGPVEGAGSINNNHQPTGNGIAVANGSGAGDEEPTCWQAEVQPGETDGWLKFGNTQYGSISGVKWEDVNGDGERQDGDLGLPGWTICLDLNENMTCDPDEPTGVTNASGEYIFENLVSGEYWVIEEQQQGWVQTAPRDVVFHRVDLEPGSNKVADFGNFKLGMIQGKKYDDLNYNGSRQSGEPYLNEWRIRLYREGEVWEPVGEELTGHTRTLGQYRFENLEKGKYKICEVLQTGWTQTQPTGTSNNEQPDEAPRCRVVTIDRSGRQRTSQVFGNTNLGSVVVYKFEDINGNGFKDENETLLSGWDIVMDKVGGSGNTQLTDENGSTVFSLTSGDYLLYENINEGWVQTGIYCDGEEVGTYDSENNRYSLILNPGQELSCYVGNFEPGRIFGYKYNDINDDGNLDVGETGVNGWGMCLKAEESEIVCSQTTTTDENGYYEFTGLRAGIYTVIEEDRSSLGWRASNPESGRYEEIEILSGTGYGEQSVGFNFYNAPPARLDLSKTNNNPIASADDIVTYTLTIQVGDRSLDDMTLVDNLPEGFIYQDGTALVDGINIEPTKSNSDKTLTWVWGEVLANTTVIVSYDIRIEPSNQPASYTNYAYVLGHGSPLVTCGEVVESEVWIGNVYAYNGTVGGQVLGTSTGEVLGASTLPAAGSETWYLLAALGLIGTGLLIRKKYLH